MLSSPGGPRALLPWPEARPSAPRFIGDFPRWARSAPCDLGCLSDGFSVWLPLPAEVHSARAASVPVGCVLLLHHPALSLRQLEDTYGWPLGEKLPETKCCTHSLTGLLEPHNGRKSLPRVSEDNRKFQHKPGIVLCSRSRRRQGDDGKERLVGHGIATCRPNCFLRSAFPTLQSLGSKGNGQCNV